MTSCKAALLLECCYFFYKGVQQSAMLLPQKVFKGASLNKPGVGTGRHTI
jgi:hypothetical protein